MRLTTELVNQEFEKAGIRAALVKATGYFYFEGPAVRDWLDRTVGVRNISAFTIKEWFEEFDRLKTRNQAFSKSIKGPATKKAVKKRPATKKFGRRPGGHRPPR